jgi:ABC-2 type transport system ATP-binding protein
VVRALVPALDQLVPRLVQANIALRELAPVVSPLETAFLALTERPESTQAQEAGQ